MSPRPRRVLFAAIDSSWAGAQAQMLELAAGLDRAAWEPLLLTAGQGALIARARAAGVRTVVLPFGLLRRRFPFVDFYLLGPLVLRRLLRREGIALVHTHDPASPLALAPVAGRLGIPVVVHVHDLDQRWITPRVLLALARARSAVVGISDAAVRWAVARGAPPALVRRIHNGVHDVHDVHGAAARASSREVSRHALNLATDDVAFALVARLVPRKGHEDAIRALAAVAGRAPTARLVFVGSAPAAHAAHERMLHALARDLGIADRVHFLGERDDVAALLGGMDVNLLPARREAFGRVIVEGMQAGLPALVYDDAALPELVRDGVDGVVVATGDMARLADAIARLATDAPWRAMLGGTARVRALEFTHARFVGKVVALYAEMVGDGHPMELEIRASPPPPRPPSSSRG